MSAAAAQIALLQNVATSQGEGFALIQEGKLCPVKEASEKAAKRTKEKGAAKLKWEAERKHKEDEARRTSQRRRTMTTTS